MANYPTTLDDSASLPTVATGTDNLSATGQKRHDTKHNTEDAAIVAIETKIGTGSSTPTTGTLLAGTGTGTSGWSGSLTLGGTGQNTAPTGFIYNSKSDGTFAYFGVGRKNSDANQVGFRLVNQAATDGWDFYIPSANTGTLVSLTNISNGTLFTFDNTPSLTIGATAADSGALRLPNAVNILWRNGANSGNVGIQFNSSNQLTIAAIAEAGAATAGAIVPTNFTAYLPIVYNGQVRKIPLYAN